MTGKGTNEDATPPADRWLTALLRETEGPLAPPSLEDRVADQLLGATESPAPAPHRRLSHRRLLTWRRTAVALGCVAVVACIAVTVFSTDFGTRPDPDPDPTPVPITPAPKPEHLRLVITSATDFAAANRDATELVCSGLSDADLSALTTFRRLSVLDLSGCTTITDSGIASVSAVESLTDLNCFGCRNLTDTAATSIASLTRLRRLDLSHSRITNSGLAELAALTDLRHLHFCSCTAISDPGLASLTGLTHIEELQFWNLPLVTRDGVLRAAQSLPGLRILGLRDCTGLSDADIAAINSALPRVSVIR